MNKMVKSFSALMQKVSISLLGCIAISMVVLTPNAMAEAKFTRSQAFDDWMLQCFETDADKENKKERCALTQGVGTNQVKLVASLSVVRGGEDEKENLLRLTLPLGISLADNVTMDIDEQGVDKMEWVTCVNGGCVASKTLNSALVKQLGSGEGVTFTAKTLKDKRDLILKFSLNGFSAGLKEVH